jgi:hypothetical protein
MPSCFDDDWDVDLSQSNNPTSLLERQFNSLAFQLSASRPRHRPQWLQDLTMEKKEKEKIALIL